MIYSSVIQINKHQLEQQEYSSVDYHRYVRGRLFDYISHKIQENLLQTVTEEYIPYKMTTELRLDLIVYSKEEFAYKMDMLRDKVKELPSSIRISILDIFKNDVIDDTVI